MNCKQVRPLLGALLDGELDPRNSGELHAHLAHCEDCMRSYRADEAVRTSLSRVGLRHDLPQALRSRIMRNLAAPAGGRTRLRDGLLRWIVWAGWPVAVCVSALLALTLAGRRTEVRDEVIALHVRSLLADHVSDVASSDGHTVKPWFAGKLDFAPPVPDLAAAGYRLIGARLDYLAGHEVAALVYQKRDHLINVVVGSRDSSGAGASLPCPTLPAAATDRGYSLRAWVASGLCFVAISDINPQDLKAFERAYARAPMSLEGKP